MKRFLKKPIFWILIGAVIFAGYGVFAYVKSSSKSPYETEAVRRADITQEVSVTGRIKPAESVDLAFEKSGKVASVNIKVGDKVVVGQVLASLTNADLAAQVAQAQASLNKERIKLEELKIGTRAEDLQVYQTAVNNAENALTDAKTNLQNIESKAVADLNNLYDGINSLLSDSYIEADDAINKQIDELFSNDNTSSPQLTFYSGSQIKADVEWQRAQMTGELAQLKLEVVPVDQNGLDAALKQTRSHLVVIRDFLTTLGEAVNQASALSQTNATNYRYYINTGRTNVVSSITSIDSKIQAILVQKSTNHNSMATAQASLNTAENSLATAQDQLALKQAGSTDEEIKSQEAQIKYAQANLDNYRAQLAKTIITSPLAGVVTKQDIKIGEIINANTTLISLMSASQFEIEANIPEADMAKVKINDRARVTLDTYGSDVIFEALVVSIEPAETIIEGVATYKARFQFIKEDGRIKSGMTANIDIETAARTNVLIVPQRAIITQGDDKIVKILQGEEVREVKVIVGLRGADGNTEILEGLKEGDKIVISTK